MVDVIFQWITANLIQIVIVVLTVIVGYFIYILIKKQIKRLTKHGKLDQKIGINILKIIKIVMVLIIFSAIMLAFIQTIGLISGLITLMGGTIIGFAAINTLGNVIAGVIIMTSRPFIIGDRIVFKDNIADVDDIKLIYTVLKTLDNIRIYVPNQTLLQEDIQNFHKSEHIRRNVSITPGFSERREKVEEALLEAVALVPAVLKEPKPYVWITNFQNYAVEYHVYVYVNDYKNIPYIDSELHKAVLDTCIKHDIDISTPILMSKVKDKYI